MHEHLLLLAVLWWAGLAACAGLIVAARHPGHTRRLLRRLHRSFPGHPRHYRTALRGWIARRRAALRDFDARRFRNLQARAAAWGHHPRRG